MAFTLTIKTSNAAFDDAGEEVARILREAADKVENGKALGTVHDYNGNTVGSWELTD